MILVNKRDGFTLVEVLVSITVFLITFMGIISGYYLIEKRAFKQEEYQYVENICLDIDKIYDNEGYSGLVSLYGFNVIEDNISSGEIYYDKDYKLCSANYKYILSYSYKCKSDVSFIISIKNDVNNYYVIKDLEYGHSRYDDSLKEVSV